MAPKASRNTAPPPEPVAKISRALPQSEEAECALLGAALLDADRVLPLAAEKGIGPVCFLNTRHQDIYGVLQELQSASRPIDVVTVTAALDARQQLVAVGGQEYLESLVDRTPTAAHAEYYAGLVSEKYILREIIRAATASIDSCFEAGDADTLLNDAEQRMFEIATRRRTPLVPWPTMIHEAMAFIEKLCQERRGYEGLATGYKDLDEKLLGLKPGEMVVLAARPSMGKTSLALNIAERIALGHTADRQAYPVAVFSLEMSAEQLVRRMLCSHAEVPASKLQGGYINSVSHGRLAAAAAALSKGQIYLDEQPGLEALEVRGRARRLKERHDIKLVVIDYLQLMHFERYQPQGRQAEVAAISGAIKAMAKELRVPVLILSQLSRAPETRDRHHVPQLSDLRDSGSIEQDADVVMFLRRPCRIPNDKEHEDRTLAYLEVAKNRNGATGQMTLHFTEEYTRFDNRMHGGDGLGEPPGRPPLGPHAEAGAEPAEALFDQEDVG